ncbi:S-layer homology domain-containing protein [Paenibacillus sp. GCM10027627]
MIAWLLIFSVFLSLFAGAGVSVHAEAGATQTTGYVTIAVEKFTLGQGYILEPVKVPLYEGENGAALLTRVLGEGNYLNKGTVQDGFYLSHVRDRETGALNIPSYILNAVIAAGGTIGSKRDPVYLGEFDYYPMSGWMFIVNNEFSPVGFSQYIPRDGDVIRNQFTVYGYGEDLGSQWGVPLITPANKDALTKAVAEINSSPDKQAMLAKKALKTAYADAYAKLQNMESTQQEVDAALAALNAAIELGKQPDKVKPVIQLTGLGSYQVTSSNEVQFQISVTDNVYDSVPTEVTLNGSPLSGQNGQYTVTLPGTDNQITVSAVDGEGNRAVKSAFVLRYAPTYAEQLNKNLAHILRTVPNPVYGTGSGDWSVLNLARAGFTVPYGYYNTYYSNVERTVIDNMLRYGGKLHSSNSTEHSRVILGLSSTGKDITAVGGYDLRAALADYTYVKNQGINGPVFALLAFDSRAYDIPAAPEGKEQTTREKLVQNILDREIKKGTADAGGWAFFGSRPDPDMTGMAMQSLAPYYGSNPDVKAAVDRALLKLSLMQNADGSFSSGGSPTSESAAQVIVALTSVGIDPKNDSRFIKNGKSVLDSLLSYALPGGGFLHAYPTSGSAGAANGMATDQGTYALVAYDRFVKGKNSLYNMTDVPAKLPEEPKPYPLPAGNEAAVVIPNDYIDYLVPITAGDSGKTITIDIPSDKFSTTYLQLPQGAPLPQIEAQKGGIRAIVPKDTQVTSGDTAKLEWLSGEDHEQSGWRDGIAPLLPSGQKLDSVDAVFSMGGGGRVEFSDYVTLIFTGKSGKQAAYIENGTAHLIAKFASDSTGRASGKPEYAYDNGSDLVVKTKHFTDFAAYSASAIPTPGGGGPTDPQQYVYLSVDKHTINKGFTLSETKVELKSGDTAWTLLQRVLGDKGITIRYKFNSQYDSVYVESIAGDGEFDHGIGSGWMYNVNGTYPNFGASKYTLQHGDKMQWRYTTNYGKDLGVHWEPGEVPGESGNENGNGQNPGESGGEKPENPGGEKPLDWKLKFTDAGQVSPWALSAIGKAVTEGSLQGSDGKLKPKGEVTRAEFAKMLVEILGLTFNKDVTTQYADVRSSDWFYPYVQAVHQTGAMSGHNGLFDPKAPITREQMAVTVSRALDLQRTGKGTALLDLKEAAVWAQNDIQAVVEAGIMQGSGGQFQPKGKVTREMAVVVAVRADEYKDKKAEETQEQNLIGVKKEAIDASEFLLQAVKTPAVSSIGGDWTVLALARGGYEVPEAYYAGYYAEVERTLKEKDGKLHNVKFTEYSRVILALSALGKDITNVAGYDLRKPLADFNAVVKQGINGPIFALIALDSNEYDIPDVPNVQERTTRDRLVDYILGREIEGGGWALDAKSTEPDVDLTAMAVQGLTPYYSSNARVKAAVDRAVAWLSKAQLADGGYSSWNSANAESSAQVVVALSGLGIDSASDKRFVKNGRSVLAALLDFAAPGGGFYHIKPGSGAGNGGAKPGEVDLMATDQALYGLAAYIRYANGNNRLYDMRDAFKAKPAPVAKQAA